MAVNEEQEFVYVRLGGDKTAVPGRVSRDAYDKVWKAKGWTIVDDADVEAASAFSIDEATITTDKKKG